jgi:hypothetical protein
MPMRPLLAYVPVPPLDGHVQFGGWGDGGDGEHAMEMDSDADEHMEVRVCCASSLHWAEPHVVCPHPNSKLLPHIHHAAPAAAHPVRAFLTLQK